MKILLIRNSKGGSEKITQTVKELPGSTVIEKGSLEEGIETLESSKKQFDAIICDYSGSSVALLECLVALRPHVPCLLILDEHSSAPSRLLSIKRPASIEIRTRAEAGQPSSNLVLQIGVSAQNRKTERVLEDNAATAEDARQTAAESLLVVHDVVGKMGFTPEIQTLAKKSVALTLKALGSSPSLAAILSRLNRDQGKYITSHSLMLAEVACAIAYKVGWGNSNAFLKLTMSAFLHDLSLNDNALARYKTLEDAKSAFALDSEKIKTFQMHPLKSAEFAQKFPEVQPDVRTIVEQHHERADGSGFPRGLHSQKILPLSSLFIIAHDFLHFFLETVPSSDKELMIDAFLHESGGRYAKGSFQEICNLLR